MLPTQRPELGPLPYRPYWQVLLIVGILSVAGYVGAHPSGQPRVAPTLSLHYFAVALLSLLLAVRFLNLGPFLTSLLEPTSDTDEAAPVYSPLERPLYPIVGFLAVFSTLLLLERAYPFYFAQDDNLDSILPVMLHGAGSFFSGVFPEWNPYQFLGAPTAVLGYYGFTYPFTYSSYWIANNILGNANAMVDVLAFTHILLGYCAFYWLLRREAVRPSLSMLASSAYAISGYALIFSRSFIQFSAILFWAPLLLICLQTLLRGQTAWKWIFAFGAVIGLSFHAGHIQMWAYSILFANIAILLMLVTGAIPLRALLPTAAAHFVGLAFAAPLLVPELLEATASIRHPEGTGILDGLLGFLLPVSLSHAPHPVNWGAGMPIGEMYYSGSLFLLVAAILLVSLLALRWDLATTRANIWLLCALVALILALGDRGFLWNVLVHLPGFSRFRFPFKFIGIINLFAILAGAIAIERLLRRRHWRWEVELPLVAIVWALLAYHASLSTAAFSWFNFSPYPAPDPDIARFLLPDGQHYPKFITAETQPDGTLHLMNPDGNRSPDPRYIDSYMNQWATLSGAFNIHGYDPIIYESPLGKRLFRNLEQDSLSAFSEYGVKYFLQYTPPGSPSGMLAFTWPGVHPVFQSRSVNLYELPNARPMSYPEADPSHALGVSFSASGAIINTSDLPAGGPVILNMFWRKEFRATADGKPIASEPDAWERIRVIVPAGTTTIRLTYRSPWNLGFLAGALLLFVGIVLGWLSIRFQNREAIPQ